MRARAIAIREMTGADLAQAADVTDEAFGGLFERLSGHPIPRPVMPRLMAPTRFAADPAGCLVATPGDAPETIIGAIFSIRRGTLAWFGPLAVAPEAQGGGVGQALTAALTERWRASGVRLMGLETFGESDLHIHTYSKLGYQPRWTSLEFRRELAPAEQSTPMPDGVEVNGAPPGLDFLYEGLDLGGEARQTVTENLGVTLACDGGFAILHTEPTFTAPGVGFLLFAAAPSKASFARLLDAAEAHCAARGLTALVTRASTANFGALNALVNRGYRAGSVVARMKQGERPDYDAARVYYCDNWL